MSAEIDLGQILRVIIPLCIFLGAAVCGILVARKYLKDNQTGHRHTEYFTLVDLQKMHSQGQITGDEFKRMKEKFIRDLK